MHGGRGQRHRQAAPPPTALSDWCASERSLSSDRSPPSVRGFRRRLPATSTLVLIIRNGPCDGHLSRATLPGHPNACRGSSTSHTWASGCMTKEHHAAWVQRAANFFPYGQRHPGLAAVPKGQHEIPQRVRGSTPAPGTDIADGPAECLQAIPLAGRCSHANVAFTPFDEEVPS